jgi:hypothetical protein
MKLLKLLLLTLKCQIMIEIGDHFENILPHPNMTQKEIMEIFLTDEVAEHILECSQHGF